MYDSIVIGCGFAGAVIAREMAEKGKSVLIVEQRSHIGGNCYDALDDYGILIHEYGPHIFHTNNKEVYDYLSRFTEWRPYQHEVVGCIDGMLVPVPFNLNSLDMVYGREKGSRLREELLSRYGENRKVPILELKNSVSEEVRELAQYVYENVFLKYTMKQWGQKPEEVDASVTARVPVYLSRDNRYFQDLYQGMPSRGYTSLFEAVLDHDNIEVHLNTNGRERICFGKEGQVYWEGIPFKGHMIYTGPIDELFDLRYGRLPYRTLHFQLEHYDKEYYQSKGVVNYTVSEDYTRITEFKHMTGQGDGAGTTIMKEYPADYRGREGEIPCYAVINQDNQELYERYTRLLDHIPNFHLLGRLAEYKYYNIDAIVEKALQLGKTLD